MSLLSKRARIAMGGAATLAFLALSIALYCFSFPTEEKSPNTPFLKISTDPPATDNKVPSESFDASLVGDVVYFFENEPVRPPYRTQFGEVGRRVRVLGEMVALTDGSQTRSRKQTLQKAVDDSSTALFPFLSRSSPGRRAMLSSLRSFQPHSVGIVIPAGDEDVRPLGHLLASLRHVIGTELPIQIAYAGDDHLSSQNRDVLKNVTEREGSKTSLEFLNLLDIFEDSKTKLTHSKQAMGPFAVLASKLEKAILLRDPTVSFLQQPDVLFEQPFFRETGVFLSQQRPSRQSVFPDQRRWWTTQVLRTKSASDEPIDQLQEFVERGEPSVVVVDKSRVDVLMGLLHVCWQSSDGVHEEVSHRLTSLETESWWVGFDLAGARYRAEQNYTILAGLPDDHEPAQGDAEEHTDGCAVAHVDETDGLVWYDGTSETGCGLEARTYPLTSREKETLEKMVDQARRVDAVLDAELAIP